MLDLKDEQKCQYEAKATSMAAALGFKVHYISSLVPEPLPFVRKKDLVYICTSNCFWGLHILDTAGHVTIQM